MRGVTGGRKVRVGILLTDGSSQAKNKVLSAGAKSNNSVWAGVILEKKKKQKQKHKGIRMRFTEYEL